MTPRPVAVDERSSAARCAALGGIVGPAAFIAAWVIGALVTEVPYSSAENAISRLAAVDADTRLLMTAGFITFAVGMAGYAVALRRLHDSPAWVAALATGAATLGVAAAPLDRSSSVDQLHAAFAVAGYVTLAAVPLLSYRALHRGSRHGLAVGGLVAAAVTAVALILTATGLPTGAMQRIGLTATDLWIIASAWTMLRSTEAAGR